MKVNERVAAVGVGYSKTGRRTGLGSWPLAIQACRSAMDDAGMTPADIDGVAVLWGVAGPEPGGLDYSRPDGPRLHPRVSHRSTGSGPRARHQRT